MGRPSRKLNSKFDLCLMGGLAGQLVSGVLWLLSAAIGAWVSPGPGIAVLCVGGALIFPVTQLVLRTMGRPATLRADNPLSHLAMQIAFTIPLGLPLVGLCRAVRPDDRGRHHAGVYMHDTFSLGG